MKLYIFLFSFKPFSSYIIKIYIYIDEFHSLFIPVIFNDSHISWWINLVNLIRMQFFVKLSLLQHVSECFPCLRFLFSIFITLLFHVIYDWKSMHHSLISSRIILFPISHSLYIYKYCISSSAFQLDNIHQYYCYKKIALNLWNEDNIFESQYLGEITFVYKKNLLFT